MTASSATDRLRGIGPRALDLALALALATILQLQLALGDHPGEPSVNAIGALLLTLPLAWRRRLPLVVALVFAAAAVAEATLGGGLFAGEPPLLASLVAGVVVFYSLGAHAEDRPALIGAAVGVTALWTSILVSGEIDLQSFLFSAGLVVAAPWLAGRTIRSRNLRAAALEREQEQRARLAVSDERARIARELHDVVAHSVGVMVVQAEGARRVLPRDPDRARDALRSIEQTGRSALAEIRRTLGVLRGEGAEATREPPPGMDDLEVLVGQAREAGLGVHVEVEGEPRPLPQGIDLSAYRVVQEALTNAVKHAGSVDARVVIRYGEHDLELEISDEGPGRSANGAEVSGHGIVGMRERVALCGGDLLAGPRPEGGFVVRARIPLEG